MNKKTLKIIAAICCLLVVCLMFSGCGLLGGGQQAGTATGDGSAPAGQSPWTMIILIVGLIAVFYFFMIRPENKRKKQVQEMRSSLGVGDDITTIGGMMGKIVEMTEDTITFETGEDRVRIKIAKWAISKKSK